MLILQMGNSIMTTRIWVITPSAVTGFFLSPIACDDCRIHHVMVIRAQARDPFA